MTVQDVQVVFLDADVQFNYGVTLELQALRLLSCNSKFVPKEATESLTQTSELSFCSTTLCALLCCGPKKHCYKLLSLEGLKCWWTQDSHAFPASTMHALPLVQLRVGAQNLELDGHRRIIVPCISLNAQVVANSVVPNGL